MKNKKGITWVYLTAIIISIVTLMLIAFYINSITNSWNYESSIQECSFLMKNSHDNKGFFGNNLNRIELTFSRTVSEVCSAKDIEVNSRSISRASNLINDCHVKFGSGTDFLGNGVRGESVCIYCGRIKVREDIDDFSTKLIENLNKSHPKLNSKETQIINLNDAFLFNQTSYLNIFLRSVSKNDELAVFYTISRPDVSSTATSWGGATQEVVAEYTNILLRWGANQVSIVGNVYNKFTGSRIPSMGGVVLTKMPDEIKGFSTTQDVIIPLNHGSCQNVIIPKKIY